MSKKTILSGLMIFFLVVFVFGDHIYLKDGSKLVGKIVNYGETLVDILLDSGRLVTVSKNEIIRLETLDRVDQSRVVAGESLIQTQTTGIKADGTMVQAGIGSPSVHFGAEVPVFLGDPELELRKRMLMYHDMKKEAWIATQMSLFIPSAGHLYTGEWERGFLFLGARAVFGGVAIWGFIPVDTGDVDDNLNPIMAPQNMTIGAIAAGGFALFTLLEAVDAYYSAERHNQLLRIRLGIEQFDPMMLPYFGR